MQQAEGSGGLLSMKSNKAHSVAVRFVLFFFLMVAVAWGAYFWWQYSIAPVDPSDKNAGCVVVRQGREVKEIAAALSGVNLSNSQPDFIRGINRSDTILPPEICSPRNGNHEKEKQDKTDGDRMSLI